MHPLCRNVLLMMALAFVLVTLEVLDLLVNDIPSSSIANALDELYLEFAYDLNVPGLQRLLEEDRVNPNAKDGNGGALIRIVNKEDESPELIAALRLVLSHPETDPNGTGNHWAPLKVAILRGHQNAIRMLLDNPKTKRTIYPAGLTCDVVAKLPEEVSLHYDRDALRCVKEHPRYRNRVTQASHALPKKKTLSSTPTAKQSTELDAMNPFQSLPSGQLPPRDQYVMNPEAFDNIVDAARYYLFGRPWSGLECAIVTILVALQLSIGTFVVLRA